MLTNLIKKYEICSISDSPLPSFLEYEENASVGPKQFPVLLKKRME